MAGPCCTLSSPLLNNDPPPIGGRGGSFLLGITYCNAKIEKTGKGGSGHDCQLGRGNDLVK
jgi:hypothetical protein